VEDSQRRRTSRESKQKYGPGSIYDTLADEEEDVVVYKPRTRKPRAFPRSSSSSSAATSSAGSRGVRNEEEDSSGDEVSVGGRRLLPGVEKGFGLLKSNWART
jgi:hypothetical protein